jgi:hypothetical protein
LFLFSSVFICVHLWFHYYLGFSFVSILTPDPSPPAERGGSSFPFSAREKGKG